MINSSNKNKVMDESKRNGLLTEIAYLQNEIERYQNECSNIDS